MSAWNDLGIRVLPELLIALGASLTPQIPRSDKTLKSAAQCGHRIVPRVSLKFFSQLADRLLRFEETLLLQNENPASECGRGRAFRFPSLDRFRGCSCSSATGEGCSWREPPSKVARITSKAFTFMDPSSMSLTASSACLRSSTSFLTSISARTSCWRRILPDNPFPKASYSDLGSVERKVFPYCRSTANEFSLFP